MCRYQWSCWTLTLLGHRERLSHGNWTEGCFRSSFNLWGPNPPPPTIKSLVLTQCFSPYLSTPIMWPLKAGEKLECACPVRDNGGVSDPWPGRLRPFFLDQALPFATVGYCCTAWQQNEGKHLLRFCCCWISPNFFSPVVTQRILFSFWREVRLRLKNAQVWSSGGVFKIHRPDSFLKEHESQLRDKHWQIH